MSRLSELIKGNHVITSRYLAIEIGFVEASFVSELIDEYEYWSIRGELNNGFFFSTIENIERRTNFSRRQQDRIVAELEKLGILEKKLQGSPQKRYFRINEEVVKQIMEKGRKNWELRNCDREENTCTKSTNAIVQKGQTHLHEKDKSNCTKRTTNKPNITNLTNKPNINNNNIRVNAVDVAPQKKKKSVSATDEELFALIDQYIADEIAADKEYTRELLVDWLNIRKAKRTPNTLTAIKLCLRSIKGLAEKSGVTPTEIIEETVKSGWLKFFEIRRNNYYGTSNRGIKQGREIKFKPNCGIIEL